MTIAPTFIRACTIFVFGAIVSGCASTQVSTPVEATAPMATQADAARGRLLVRMRLKDPDSAKFSPDLLKPGAVCGLVNAKNSFGAYAGSEPWLYIVQTGQAMILTEGQTTSEKTEVLRLFERYCGSSEHS
jgi:hypothetical protein